MSVELPKPIAAYIAAENAHDTEALGQCFADDAVVRDESRTIEGLMAIKDWKAENHEEIPAHSRAPCFLSEGRSHHCYGPGRRKFPREPHRSSVRIQT